MTVFKYIFPCLLINNYLQSVYNNSHNIKDLASNMNCFFQVDEKLHLQCILTIWLFRKTAGTNYKL